MSIIAYAQLTNARDAAAPGTSSAANGSPGIGTYVDAFAALVPAEVLTLHALIISVTTKTAQLTTGKLSEARTETVTTILPEGMQTLTISFWVLVVLSAALYITTRLLAGKWDKYDYIRLTIAPLAFVGWTMLQRSTAFDAAFPGVPPIPRTVTALFLGAILGVVTTVLAMLADRKS